MQQKPAPPSGSQVGEAGRVGGAFPSSRVVNQPADNDRESPDEPEPRPGGGMAG
jgi:hypothetical protein